MANLNPEIRKIAEDLQSKHKELSSKLEPLKERLKFARNKKVSRQEVLSAFSLTINESKKRFLDKLDEFIDITQSPGFKPAGGAHDPFFNYRDRTTDSNALCYLFGDMMLAEVSKRLEIKIPSNVNTTYSEKDKAIAEIESEIADLETQISNVRAALHKIPA